MAEDCILSVNGVESDVPWIKAEVHGVLYGITAQVNRMWDILESPGKCTLTVLRPTDPWPAAVSSRAVFP